MTYTELKDELYLVRERERIIDARLKSLATLKDDYLARLNNGVTDYSRDAIQKSRDPDAALVAVIDDLNRDTDKLIASIKALREANEYYKGLILSSKDIGGEVLRLFFLERLSMKQVSKTLSYAEKYTWKLWRQAIEELTEVINNENSKA